MPSDAPQESRKNWRTLLQKFLPDLVYGANDGLITTFAIVAGVAGASLSNSVVLILGFASLFADGFSMATSDYLAERTPTDRKKQRERGVAVRHGFATFVGFIVPGVVPLVAYLLPIDPAYQFPLAAVLTLVTLFAVGAGRGAVSRLPPWKAGAEMLLVGALAAAVAYGVGMLGSAIADGRMPVATFAAPPPWSFV